MGFVTRELERLSRALRDQPDGNRYTEIYAAQQALSWVLDPEVFRSPCGYLVTGTAPDEVGCSAETHLPRWSDNDGQ